MSVSDLLNLAEADVSAHEVAAECIETFLHLALDAATCTRCNASRLAHSAPSRRMQGVFQYVDDSEEQRKVLQHVIESSLQSSMTLLTMGYVNRQPSYTSTRAEDNLSWEALDEPPPCEGDSWARVALDVKVRTPKVAITIDDKPGSGRRAGARPSRSRRQSAAGPTSQSSRRGGRSRPSSALSPEAGASESEAAGPSGATRQTPAEDIPRVRGSKKERERPQGGGDDMEARLRKELELRRQAEMAAKRAAQRQEEEKAQLKAMKKELRGRDYTYDFRGEVMLLTRVDGDRLPSAMLTPAVKVTAAKPSIERSTTNAATKSTFNVNPTLPTLDTLPKGPDYVPQESDGPTVHHDVIRLTGGVTLREGTSTRSGPKLTSYGDKLTREAYLMRSGKMAPQPESEEEEEEDEGRDTVGPLPGHASGRAQGDASKESSSVDDVTRQVLDMLRDDSAAVVPAPAIERNGAPGTPVLPAWAHDAVYVPPGAEGSLPGASVSREKRRGSPDRSARQTPRSQMRSRGARGRV